MKIYLASRFSRLDEMRGYAEELIKDGHEITSSWNFGGEEGLTFTDIAILDVDDVLRADAVVSFTEPYGSSNIGGGRHSEFGVALAARKKLYIVGEREQVFHWWPTVVQFPAFKHLRNHLKGKKSGDKPTSDEQSGSNAISGTASKSSNELKLLPDPSIQSGEVSSDVRNSIPSIGASWRSRGGSRKGQEVST